MKKLILILCFVYSGASAGTLQKKASEFFKPKPEPAPTVEITNNVGGNGSSDAVKDSPGAKESVWNLDIYGMELISPDQPADQQFMTQISGFGVTYKFSEVAHFWGTYSKFSVDGVNLGNVDTEWQHEHMLGGGGLRFPVGTHNQLSVNFGLGQSKIKETAKYGSVGNLKTTMATTVKYLWLTDNANFGLNLSMIRADSKASTWESYHKGGYFSVGLTASFGVPDLSAFKL